MNKGFTLIETMVAMCLVMLAVLFSARIIVFALEASRRSSLRFRLVETLDDYKNRLSSLLLHRPGPRRRGARGSAGGIQDPLAGAARGALFEIRPPDGGGSGLFPAAGLLQIELFPGGGP